MKLSPIRLKTSVGTSLVNTAPGPPIAKELSNDTESTSPWLLSHANTRSDISRMIAKWSGVAANLSSIAETHPTIPTVAWMYHSSAATNSHEGACSSCRASRESKRSHSSMLASRDQKPRSRNLVKEELMSCLCRHFFCFPGPYQIGDGYARLVTVIGT
jgi:hypothetical protein